MSRKSIVALCAAALFCAVVALVERPVDAQRRQTSSTPSAADSLKVLQWRSIGPYRGGRSTAVAGVASQPMVFYFGGVGGGVWRTTDGGINWEPITDGSVVEVAGCAAIQGRGAQAGIGVRAVRVGQAANHAFGQAGDGRPMAFNTEVRFSDYGGASDPGIQEERFPFVFRRGW